MQKCFVLKSMRIQCSPGSSIPPISILPSDVFTGGGDGVMPLMLYETVRGQVKVIMLQEVSRLSGHSVILVLLIVVDQMVKELSQRTVSRHICDLPTGYMLDTCLSRLYGTR